MHGKFVEKQLYNFFVEEKIITGHAREENLFVPRIPIIASEYSFAFKIIVSSETRSCCKNQ